MRQRIFVRNMPQPNEPFDLSWIHLEWSFVVVVASNTNWTYIIPTRAILVELVIEWHGMRACVAWRCCGNYIETSLTTANMTPCKALMDIYCKILRKCYIYYFLRQHECNIGWGFAYGGHESIVFFISIKLSNKPNKMKRTTCRTFQRFEVY